MMQVSLLNVLPLGVWHYPEMFAPGDQKEMCELVREIVRDAPLDTPRMPGGVDFNLRSSSAGEYGWVADGTGFFYARKQATGRPWPRIPTRLLDAAKRVAQAAGFSDYAPNSCLINYYERGKGSLGLHRDDTRGEDFKQPVVSISLGDTAIFGIGGNEKTDRIRKIELHSGDAFILGASGRKYFHQVLSIQKGTSQLLQRGGRVSLTFRRVFLK